MSRNELRAIVQPLSLKNAPALIERLLPVQKLSVEVYKERMAGGGQTLTALGSYWKGRKPLILNKACILGCLLPATDNPRQDLEIFEKLMALDDESFVIRAKRRPNPREILATLNLARPHDYFTFQPASFVPPPAPWDWSQPAFDHVQVDWRQDIKAIDRRRLESQMLPKITYRERVESSYRPEEVMESVHDHIWDSVNAHLSTNAHSFPELIEQLGIMRFGHRPRIGDPLAGSGQIPFEAARLGCDAYAADLNPVACMLTWGAFNVIGGEPDTRQTLRLHQQELVQRVQAAIDQLGIETDGHGWRAKVYLYCVEVRCPQTDWMVPLMPSFIISKPRTGAKVNVVAELIPDSVNKRYNIAIRSHVSPDELDRAEKGTVRSDGRGQDPYMVHTVNGIEYRTKISTLRGDYRKRDGTVGNRLRLWEKSDVKPRNDDIFQERLYCIQWTRPKENGQGDAYEFRAVTPEDLQRESVVDTFVARHLTEWQDKGWIPDMQIEPGDKTDEPIRTRGWTHWHHLFTPRQLLIAALTRPYITAELASAFFQSLNLSCRLSRWSPIDGGGGSVKQVFYNQALNTFWNYGCRASQYLTRFFTQDYPLLPLQNTVNMQVECQPVEQLAIDNDIYITDPPYGDAVKYEEILDFFIAWFRQHPPREFGDWVWDGRRSIAIRGEDENFRRGMVIAYQRMTEHMSDNGLQVIMFTHQSGALWTEMANIVWASGLQVTAAWYVATETESALREGSYVKGTVLLVCRRRKGMPRVTRDDLAWDLQEEVEAQIASLVGLNQQAKGLYRDDNVFQDADLQMAGYAAALRVLTTYAVIDGHDMTVEALRPRVAGETTLVDELITFAVETANRSLVPHGIGKQYWDKLSGPERFYLKMLDMEVRGIRTLDNYQNFAKAFKIRDFYPLMGDRRANRARLKSAVEFGRSEMGEGSQLYQTVLRAVLYAIMELVKDVATDEVVAHLSLNVPNYFGDVMQRELVVSLTDYLTQRWDHLRPEEASAARVLRELVIQQRLG